MTLLRRYKQRRPCRGNRSATATVEFAIVLPIFLIMIFGTIEICQMVFLKQTATVCAYEGARMAVRQSNSTQNVVDRIETLLQQRRVVGGSVTITPDLATADTLTQIRVRITIPTNQNTPLRFVVPNPGDIVSDAFMLRE